MGTTYVYIRSEPQLWTVGFYDPSGKWQSESDHGIREDAARRIHYLNGGTDAKLIADLKGMHRHYYVEWKVLEDGVMDQYRDRRNEMYGSMQVTEYVLKELGVSVAEIAELVNFIPNK